jgi:hypothetical protein
MRGAARRRIENYSLQRGQTESFSRPAATKRTNARHRSHTVNRACKHHRIVGLSCRPALAGFPQHWTRSFCH